MIAGNSFQQTRVTIATPIRFNTKPIRTISPIRTLPVPKAIAFGGVPTGSMKDRLFERVAGNINIAGFMPPALAAAARIGIKTFDVAVLLVTSDRNVTARQTMPITANGGQSRSPTTN